MANLETGEYLVYLCFGGQPVKAIPYGVARRLPDREKQRQFELDAK